MTSRRIRGRCGNKESIAQAGTEMAGSALQTGGLGGAVVVGGKAQQ